VKEKLARAARPRSIALLDGADDFAVERDRNSWLDIGRGVICGTA
jgi:hypothetical protein